jgi:hypothetical protein
MPNDALTELRSRRYCELRGDIRTLARELQTARRHAPEPSPATVSCATRSCAIERWRCARPQDQGAHLRSPGHPDRSDNGAKSHAALLFARADPAELRRTRPGDHAAASQLEHDRSRRAEALCGDRRRATLDLSAPFTRLELSNGCGRIIAVGCALAWPAGAREARSTWPASPARSVPMRKDLAAGPRRSRLLADTAQPCASCSRPRWLS